MKTNCLLSHFATLSLASFMWSCTAGVTGPAGKDPTANVAPVAGQVDSKTVAGPLPAQLEAPQDFKALAGNGQVSLEWATVSGALSYDVYVSSEGAPTKTSAKLGDVSSGYVHDGLVNGATYYYVVTAVSGARESELSEVATATPSLSSPDLTSPSQGSQDPPSAQVATETLETPPAESSDLVVKTKVKIKKTYVYAGAQYTNKVWQFALTEGRLVPLASPSSETQTLPITTVASVDGKELFVANYSSNSISAFAIEPTTGALTLREHFDLGTAANPAWVAVHPTKPVLYSANSGTGKVAVLDVAPSGLLTLHSDVTAGNGVTCVLLNAAGTLLYAVAQNADEIDIYSVAADGGLAFIRAVSLPSGSLPNQAALSPNGKFLYVADWGTKTIDGFAINGDDLTSLGASVSSGAGGVYTVSIAPDGTRLFAAKPYGNAYSEHTLDVVTGAIGVAQETPKAGAVSFLFLNDKVFGVAWTNAGAGLAIDERSYTSASGIAESGTTTTEAYQGLYQLTPVTVEVEAD